MDFSAVPLGKALGIEVRQPYLFPKVVDYALGSLAREDLVGPVRPELLTEDVRRGIERFCRAEDLGRLEGGVTHGKLALREAFPGVYSAWRSKDPIEVWGRGLFCPFHLGNFVQDPLDKNTRKRQGWLYNEEVVFREAFPVASAWCNKDVCNVWDASAVPHFHAVPSSHRDDSKGQEKRGSGKFAKRGCPASFWQGRIQVSVKVLFSGIIES